MPNPITRFKDDGDNVDLGNKLITKDYLMSVYPQIANQLITPELWIWGRGDLGSLGNNDINDSLTPITTFSGGANWKQMSCGNGGIVAIKTDGSLWVWGRNESGQLGINTTEFRYTPVPVFGGGNDWRYVYGGNIFTLAIKTDGSLWAWGGNNTGALGTNDLINRLTPVTTFLGGNDWNTICAGGGPSFAIKNDGSLWTWGSNANGTLGVDDTINRLTPVTTFLGGNNWKAVDNKAGSVISLKTDGSIWTWGGNSSGQLGIGTTSVNVLTPVTIFGGGNNWKQVGSSGGHMIAIKTDGTLWTWGRNDNGSLGINTTGDALTPVTTFAGGTNWKTAMAGSEGVVGGNLSSVAIKTDGTLWTWGGNTRGQLGVGDTSPRPTPTTTFAGDNDWKSVSLRGQICGTIKSVNQV